MVDGNFKAVAAGNADAGGEEAVFGSEGFNLGDPAGMCGDQHGGSGLGEQAEERMNHEGLVLLDGSADILWKSGLGQGYREAAVREVAGGTEQLMVGEDGEQGVEIGFGVKVKRRRLAPQAAKNYLGVFGRAKGDQLGGGEGFGVFRVLGNDRGLTAEHARQWAGIVFRLIGMKGHMEIGVGLLAGGDRPKKKDGVALGLEVRGNGFGNVVEDADDAEDGGRIDAFAAGFIVERDVAAGDGGGEGGAGFGDAVNGGGELGHDFRLLRVAEVEAVGGSHWGCAGAGYLAGGFGYCVHGA